jgi:hypothetical protein
MRRVILSVALVALGIGGGYVLGAVRVPPPAPTPVARGHAELPPVVIADRGISEADLRRVVKEELAARGAGQGGGGAGELAPPPPSGNPAAYDEGMRHVNQAIAQRKWTPDDATALEHALETASPEQRVALLHTLVPALNRGDVKLTYRGAAF